MGLNSLGMGEILILMLFVLLIFGARRLPEMGASLGKGIREFKRSLTEATDALNARIDEPGQRPPVGSKGDAGAADNPSRSSEPKRLAE
jgi:sec-independent protein translocase protein TatA